MRYDADKFLRRRWHELHDTPRGMEARDFVRLMAGDPRPLRVQSPTGVSSQPWPVPVMDGTGHFSREGR